MASSSSPATVGRGQRATSWQATAVAPASSPLASGCARSSARTSVLPDVVAPLHELAREVGREQHPALAAGDQRVPGARRQRVEVDRRARPRGADQEPAVWRPAVLACRRRDAAHKYTMLSVAQPYLRLLHALRLPLRCVACAASRTPLLQAAANSPTSLNRSSAKYLGTL